ncbi:MAG: hypothetical protein QOD75_2333 [Blastocatellia bacterium]|jgi:hypothetical protein|nr:hypothetical protein [Blastocatellia bacterium]
MFDRRGFSIADTASKCFNENLGDYGNDPEKYNLYYGLANLAAAIENIQNRLDHKEADLSLLPSRPHGELRIEESVQEFAYDTIKDSELWPLITDAEWNEKTTELAGQIQNVIDGFMKANYTGTI